MPNLIEELTPEYCNDKLVGAMFMKDGEPHQFRAADGNGVAARKFSVTPDKVTTKNVTIPSDYFQGWAALEYPKLGYRMAGNGQLLAYISRNNSVQRGLSVEDVRIDLHEVSYQCQNTFGFNLDHYANGNGLIPLVMCPAYLPFAEGLAKVLSGDIPSFALSADFAVAPNNKVPFLEVLFRQRRIGTIDESGKVEIVVQGMAPSWKHVTKEM